MRPVPDLSRDGRKEWGQLHGAFSPIWAELAEFRRNIWNREKTQDWMAGDQSMRIDGALSIRKGTSRLRGEKNGTPSESFEGGRKKWARRPAAFLRIWAEFAEFRHNTWTSEKT
jgi:hypothetical protein